jgi:Zinc carboxypeptidase/Cytosolic carboxypeptidase N-terminal domain
MPVRFSSDFECGNGIDFREESTRCYSFDVRSDCNSTDRQWFFFAVEDANGMELELSLRNINGTNMPGAWPYCRPVFSTDEGKTWSRIAETGICDYDANQFTFRHQFSSNRELVAVHYPYSNTHCMTRIEAWSKHPLVQTNVIGKSMEGRPIHRLMVSDGGSNEGKKGIWVTTRNHAAESPGSFVMDGFIDFLLSEDPVAKALRGLAVINLVPMINPDGNVAGHYRDNMAGVNLNRVWDSPNAETSPEVLAVTDAVAQWVEQGNPYDFYIDFHADSAAREHYAFHPTRCQLEGQLDNPEEYYKETVRFLNLVAGDCADFLPGKGASFMDQPGVSYQFMRNQYKVLSLTPEGGYNEVTHGANSATLLNPKRHRAVGVAFARALYRFYKEG